MKRREVLKYTAYATGIALSAPLLVSLSSCNPDQLKKVANYKTSFFSNDQFKLLSDLIDTILPKTDSPSASDVGVHQIIDNMVGNVYEKKDRTAYQDSFSVLEKAINNEKSFENSSTDDKVKIIENLGGEELAIFNNLKQQTIAYYLSTEEIGKNFLNYLPVPGKYEGCITLESVGGKKWAI